MSRDSATSLAPGFRFHPTDEELIRYYLKRKVCGRSFRFDAISEIDIYKSEPWDLPDMSRLKSRDLEWYFFSVLDKKYSNGCKTNRATEKGYWKTTGKDRPIYYYSRVVGMKKTLVYHNGRAPRGQRTNWVMHEYRLVDEELEKACVTKEAFVLCRIFQKSGSGPKNGERYGAPFVEEEWDDEEVVMVPGEHAAEEGVLDNDVYVEASDFEQNADISISPESAPFTSNFYYGEASNYVENPPENAPPSSDVCYGDINNYVEGQPESAPPSSNMYYGDTSNYIEDAQNLFLDEQKPFIGNAKDFDGSNQVDDQQFFDLPEQYEVDAKPMKDDYFVETSNEMNPLDADYLLYEPQFHGVDNAPPNEGLFLETNDLSRPVEADPSSFDMLDEYLAYFNADDDNLHYMPAESSNKLISESLLTNEESGTEKCVEGESKQLATMNRELSKANDIASSSHQNSKDDMVDPDAKYSFLKQATRMLGNFPAPPAFAAEYPTKDAALRLASAAQSPSSVRVTAGIVRIRDMTSSGNGLSWSFNKMGNLELTISITLPESGSNSSLNMLANYFSRKTASAMSRDWLYLIFFWVLFLPISYKLGTLIYSK